MPKDLLDELLEVPEKPLGFWRELWLLAWAGTKIYLAMTGVMIGAIVLIFVIAAMLY